VSLFVRYATTDLEAVSGTPERVPYIQRRYMNIVYRLDGYGGTNYKIRQVLQTIHTALVITRLNVFRI